MENQKDVRNPAGFVIRLLKNGTAKTRIKSFRNRKKPKPITVDTPSKEKKIRFIQPEKELPLPEATAEEKIKTLTLIGRITKEQAETCLALAKCEKVTKQEISKLLSPKVNPSAEIEQWLKR